MTCSSCCAALVLVFAGALACACGSSQPPLYGPGPEYEAPNAPDAAAPSGPALPGEAGSLPASSAGHTDPGVSTKGG